jgi:hypothetical protein
MKARTMLRPAHHGHDAVGREAARVAVVLEALADVVVLDFGKRNGGEVWHGNAT